jgi:NAD dependent epimerase/dehydratase family enzyme
MRLLIIGGMIFLGCHLVEVAILSGHQITLFHHRRHGAEISLRYQILLLSEITLN